MSLRKRLTFSLLAILVLFAINVLTHFWGSYARSESMVAYREAIYATQISRELERLLDAQQQATQELAIFRTTGQSLGQAERNLAEENVNNILNKILELGIQKPESTNEKYQSLWESSQKLLNVWRVFYQEYNRPVLSVNVNDKTPFDNTLLHLTELSTQQTLLASQRAEEIDNTIALSDTINAIGFIMSIFLTTILGFFLIKYTNKSLKRLRVGTEQFGSGNLDYRINLPHDEGELGDLGRAFNTMSDKLKIAINEVREARDSADDANEAKTRFLANVSHEFRTPLTGIIGYSEMLQDELRDHSHQLSRDQFYKDLDRIVGSGRHLLNLINDILNLSKIETGKMMFHNEDFYPQEIITEVCQSLEPLLKQNENKLEIEALDSLPLMCNDRTKFGQIFTNLLSNACKFTTKGEIKVSAKIDEAQSDWLRFSVSDTGIGINQSQQEKIFQAFVQADNTMSAHYGGTGLGLAICRELCTLMGGTIDVESLEGSGSTFIVQLPVAGPTSVHASV